MTVGEAAFLSGAFKKPWQKCPVCEGRGTMPADFYTGFGYGTHTQPVMCKSCEGKGMVR